MVPSVLKTIEISLLQFIDKVVDVLVLQVVHLSPVPVVEKTGVDKIVPIRQFLDKVVACPLVCNNRCLS